MGSLQPFISSYNFDFPVDQDRDFATETVKFGPERMYIDCWVRKHTYDAFKEVLGSGMQYHLQVSGRFCLPFNRGAWEAAALAVWLVSVQSALGRLRRVTSQDRACVPMAPSVSLSTEIFVETGA